MLAVEQIRDQRELGRAVATARAEHTQLALGKILSLLPRRIGHVHLPTLAPAGAAGTVDPEQVFGPALLNAPHTDAS